MIILSDWQHSPKITLSGFQYIKEIAFKHYLPISHYYYNFYFQCLETEFTCNDGNCISLDKRCNILRDCPDNSDEIHCDLVRIVDDQVPISPVFYEQFLGKQMSKAQKKTDCLGIWGQKSFA